MVVTALRSLHYSCKKLKYKVKYTGTLHVQINHTRRPLTTPSIPTINTSLTDKHWWFQSPLSSPNVGSQKQLSNKALEVTNPLHLSHISILWTANINLDESNSFAAYVYFDRKKIRSISEGLVWLVYCMSVVLEIARGFVGYCYWKFFASIGAAGIRVLTFVKSYLSVKLRSKKVYTDMYNLKCTWIKNRMKLCGA